MDTRNISVQRFTVVSRDSFHTVVARLDQELGHPEMSKFHQQISEARNLQ